MKNKREQFMNAYDEMADVVFRRCLFKTSDREVAQDLTQDTFTRVWDYLVAGNTVDNLNGFIYTVANNLIKDYYKKKKAKPVGEMGNFDPQLFLADESENIEAKIDLDLVKETIQELKEKDRQVLLMHYIEGYEPKEIGEIMDERPNTISVRIHRAKKRLQELFDDKQS